MRRLLLACALGAMLALAFAPLAWSILSLPALAGLFALWRGRSPRQAASLGFAFGMGQFLTGVSWIYVSLHDVGGLNLPLAVVAVILFAAVLAVFPALAGWLTARVLTSPVAGGWPAVVVPATSWLLSEWARGWVLTGFPWLALGYAHTPPSPFAGFAPLVGVYGVGGVVSLCAAALVLLVTTWRQPGRRSSGAWGVLLALPAVGLLLGQVSWTAPLAVPPLQVALLQGNVAQGIKWDPARLQDSLQAYSQLAWQASREGGIDVLVLPETAIPLMADQVPAEYWQLLGSRLPAHGSLVVGLARGEPDGRYFNSALVIPASGCTGDCSHYSKAHLVPFGEFVPPLFAWFVQQLNMPLSGFAAGAPAQPPLQVAGTAVGLNICYEDVFGEELLPAAREAGWLLNLSNTAWFGDSWAQPQHLQIARLRALETGRPMLRATNTGMTAHVAPDGHVVAVLPPFQRGLLLTEVVPYGGLTPYARWGNLPVVLLALAGLWLGWRQRTRRD